MDSETIVILGAGVMGLSAAYYLSNEIEPSKIHIFDPAPRLFDCASGNAAGFLAQDWFSSSTMIKLGEISLSEHKKLAQKYNGRELWGYLEGRALSYQESSSAGSVVIGDDWLWEGGSRSVIAPSQVEEGKTSYLPEWLRPGTTEDLSTPGSTTQVNPRDLCKFLLKTCQDRGVHIHHPARVESVLQDFSGITGVEWFFIGAGALGVRNKLSCSQILLAAGPWSPLVFDDLFAARHKSSRIPIAPLAGWSIVIDLPHSQPNITSSLSSDAIFSSVTEEGFTPEFFTRIRSRQIGCADPAKREIWLGGLNSYIEPLPDASAPVLDPPSDDPKIKSLLSVAKRFFIYSGQTEGDSRDVNDSTETAIVTDSLSRLIKTSLCFRPATKTGRPIIGCIPAHMYQGYISSELASNHDRVEGRTGGLFICSGHGPWGIALSLGSGKIISEIMLHGDQNKAWDPLGIPSDM